LGRICCFAAAIVALSVLAAHAAQAQSADALLNLPDDPAVSLQQSTSPAPPPGSAGAPAAGDQSTAGQSAEEIRRKKAQEQLEVQEHQRVMGVMATFNTTNNRDAIPLTPSQKFSLFFKSAIDPWPFLLSGVISGIGQADDSFPAYGQGVQGYAKRYGAAYADYFIGNFFGNAVLTSLMHEDPRYFQRGTGSKLGRFWWAAASTVWCKRDNGTWGPNYANVGGNLIGAAISNVYYPSSEHTFADTISRGLTTSAEGVIGAEVIEFWPDYARYHKRKHAEKLAREQAKIDAQSAAQAAPAPAKPQD
jgi:hypothetical protein